MSKTVLALLVEVEELVAPDASVSLQDYLSFWESKLQKSREQPGHFLIILIAKLLLLETGLYRSLTCKEMVKKAVAGKVKSSDLRPVVDTNVSGLKSTIFNTIMFVSLYYYRRTKDSELSGTLTTWKTFLNASSSPEHTYTREWLENFFGDDERMQVMWLVEQCFRSTFSNDQYIICTQTQVASSLIPYYLQNVVVEDPAKADVVLETAAMFLAHPNTTQAEILSLLHMIRQFVRICPSIRPAVIDSMFCLLKQKFYIWPKPYSNVVKEVLQMLSIERKCPGHHLRQRFCLQHPAIAGNRATGSEQTVNLLLDKNCAKVPALEQLIRCFDESAASVSQSDVKVQLLCSIFELELASTVNAQEIKNLGEAMVDELLMACLQLLDEAVMMKHEDAKEFKAKEIGRIKAEVAQQCRLSVRGCLSRPELPPLQFDIQYLVCDNGDPAVDLDRSSGVAFPRRSSTTTIIDLLNQQRMLPPPAKGKLQAKIAVFGNDSTIHHLCSCFASLSCTHSALLDLFDIQLFFVPVGLSNFGDWLGRQDTWYGRSVTGLVEASCRLYPSTIATPSPANALAMNLLKNVDFDAMPPSPEVKEKKKGKKKGKAREKELSKEAAAKEAQPQLERAPGSDLMDTAIVEIQRMMAFRKDAERATRGSGQEPKRLTRSGTGGMIAHFARQTTYRCDVVLPNLMLRKELQNFFREAETSLDLRLFQCECWLRNSQKSDYIIPFFQSAELGYVAEVRAMDESLEDTQPETAAVASARYKNMVLPILFLKAQLCDLYGEERSGPSYSVKTYLSLIMANVPSIADERCSIANPADDWLEVHFTDIDSKKRKNETQIHTTAVEVATAAQKFSVLLDDHLYGPFHKIRVSRCVTDKGKAVSLPIMTFNPLVEYEPDTGPMMGM